MNAAEFLAHTPALQRKSQMTKLAQMSQLWHSHRTGSPVPATSHLLDFLLFWEEVSESPPSSFRNLHGMSEVPGVRFLSLPVHTLPSELKASRIVWWQEGCFLQLNFSSSFFLCLVTLQHRMNLKSQRVHTLPAKAVLPTPSCAPAPAGTKPGAPHCKEKPECVGVNIKGGIF